MSHRNGSFDKFVVCPFYHWSTFNRICCEGVQNNNTTNLMFGEKSKTREYMGKFCCDIDKYRTCAIYGMLNRKYGG